MSWAQTIRMAIKSIANNKVRSFLTMLGIIIGVAAVITLVATVQGSAKLTQLQYEAMGTNQVIISGYGISGSAWSKLEDKLDTDPRISAWTPQDQYLDWNNSGIKYRAKTLGDQNSQNYIYFGNQNYGLCTNHTISTGRDITEDDCQRGARVCVIGETVRKSFFGAMSPMGQSIRIGGMSFEVIGVYKGKYGGKINTEDQMVLLPYTLKARMMSDNSSSNKNYFVRVKEKSEISAVMNDLRAEMAGQYDEMSGYFDCYSNAQWQEQEQSATNQMALLVGGVAGISLLVGGIGIMNIMLVSVTERTREIGIRMAIGARKRDIIGQFLIEAAAVSCCGGLVGIMIGCFGAAFLGNMLLQQQLNSGWMPSIEGFTVLPSIPLVLGAFLFSALLGIIFGLYPANKASNLQPVDALRTQ